MFHRLEEENENLSTQIITARDRSTFSKTNIDDAVELKKTDEQVSEIRKMYNDIEMKNNYHAQLVENFMKSVKMIEYKIEHHSKLHEIQVERAKSQMEIAEMKRTALEETIDQLKKRLQQNQVEHQDLMSKMDEFQHIVTKLKTKNRALRKELLKYKHPVQLEKNIQKMIALRNMLFNIVHKSDNDWLPLQDNQLSDIMRQIDNDSFYSNTSSTCAGSVHQIPSKPQSS